MFDWFLCFLSQPSVAKDIIAFTIIFDPKITPRYSYSISSAIPNIHHFRLLSPILKDILTKYHLFSITHGSIRITLAVKTEVVSEGRQGCYLDRRAITIRRGICRVSLEPAGVGISHQPYLLVTHFSFPSKVKLLQKPSHLPSTSIHPYLDTKQHEPQKIEVASIRKDTSTPQPPTYAQHGRPRLHFPHHPHLDPPRHHSLRPLYAHLSRPLRSPTTIPILAHPLPPERTPPIFIIILQRHPRYHPFEIRFANIRQRLSSSKRRLRATARYESRSRP